MIVVLHGGVEVVLGEDQDALVNLGLPGGRAGDREADHEQDENKLNLHTWITILNLLLNRPFIQNKQIT